ncbi:MAG: hypothetical protein II945_10115 [Bacteroidales bacterium]|nr:hypothetical protein [Bacteroidales bacterium]
MPDDLFWKILCDSCMDFGPIDFGKILSFNFWEHTSAENTTNKRLVEPDVWIETEKRDVIIEAKMRDSDGQYAIQWKNEIQSIINEQKNNDKPIILIALGGNENMQAEKVLDSPIYKVSWYSLMNTIIKEREKQADNGFVCRILDDVIEVFARQGMMRIQWFDSLPKFTIKERALVLWFFEFNNTEY